MHPLGRISLLLREAMCARVAARHLWYAAVGGSDDDCGRHRAGDPAGRPKHTRCAGSGTTQSSAAPCVLRGERKLKQSHIGAVVTTVGCAGRATRQGDRSTLDVLGVRQTANHRACSTVCDRAPTMSDRRLPSDRRQKNHLKFFFQNFSKSGPVRSGSVGAPQWVDLGTVSRASSRTSVRSQAKKIIFLKKFSKIFLSPVRSCGRHSGFHVLPFVLPSDRRKKRRRVHGRQTHGGAALWVSQHREGSKPDKKKRCFPANTQFRQLIFLAF